MAVLQNLLTDPSAVNAASILANKLYLVWPVVQDCLESAMVKALLQNGEKGGISCYYYYVVHA